MPPANDPIFRPRSLERLAAPDRLDEALRVVRPRAWLALAVLSAVLGLGVAWSVVGRVPVVAEGAALLTRPASLVHVQAPGDGVVEEVLVRVGDAVVAGQLLARLDLPDLQKRIEQEELHLQQAQKRAEDIRRLEHELAQLDRGLLAEQRRILDERILSVDGDAREVRERTGESVARQRQNLRVAQELSAGLLEKLETLRQSYLGLRANSDLSEDQIVDLESRLLDRRLRAQQIAVDAQELALREILAEELYNRQRDQVADLRLRLQDLDVELAGIDRRLQVRELEDQAGIEAIELELELLRGRHLVESRVESRHDGRLIEVTTFVGERVRAGDRLGRVEIDAPGAPLMALAYLPIADGKRTRPGARIVVSPSTVERERYGGIVGEVVSVSSYAVTTLAVANQIGDAEVARTLLGGESRIEVLARLELDPDSESGFRWTSGGGPPDLPISAGTTARVRTTLEERAPISFVLPFLRDTTGL